jgi:hypothetical protein
MMPWALRSVMSRPGGDIQAGGDVAQARARVVGDAYQHPGVAGQETPVRHDQTVYHLF